MCLTYSFLVQSRRVSDCNWRWEKLQVGRSVRSLQQTQCSSKGRYTGWVRVSIRLIYNPPLKSLLVSSGFVRINDGYDYKPLYVARAHISNKGKRIGKICGEVSEGALGESVLNDFWKNITDWSRFSQRWSLTATGNMNPPNIKCSFILDLYYLYLPLHYQSLPLNFRLDSRILLSLSPFRPKRVQVSRSLPSPFLLMRVQVYQSHRSRFRSTRAQAYRRGHRSRVRMWECRHKSASHGIPHTHLYSPK